MYFVSQMNNKAYKWNTSSHFLSFKVYLELNYQGLFFKGWIFVKYVEQTNKLMTEEKITKQTQGTASTYHYKKYYSSEISKS